MNGRVRAVWLAACVSCAAIATGQSNEASPVEPDLVMPTVVLEIDDVAAVAVQSGLPEEELTAPERALPLPEAGDLRVVFPGFDLSPPGTNEGGGSGLLGPDFVAEGVIGGGNHNFVHSSISLLRLGSEPRFEITFLHEALDGYAGELPGSGHNYQEDTLSADLRTSVGSGQLETGGSFSTIERGLQGLTNYGALVDRDLRAQLDMTWPLDDGVSLQASTEGSSFTRTFTGTSPLSVSQLGASLGFELTFSRDTWNIALDAAYRFRGVIDAADLTRHRLSSTISGGLDLPAGMRLESILGVAWSGGGSPPAQLIVPAELFLSGTPLDAFTFRLGGGYGVRQYDLDTLFQEFPLLEVPASLAEDPGWYASASVQIAAGDNLRLLAGADLHGHTRLLVQDTTPINDSSNPYHQLFALSQEGALLLEPRAGFRWTLAPATSVDLDWTGTFLDRAGFTPVSLIALELRSGSINGDFGLENRVEFVVVPGQAIHLPEVSARLSVRFSEVLRLLVDVQDLLGLVASEQRVYRNPFVDVGPRAAIMLQMSL